MSADGQHPDAAPWHRGQPGSLSQVTLDGSAEVKCLECGAYEYRAPGELLPTGHQVCRKHYVCPTCGETVGNIELEDIATELERSGALFVVQYRDKHMRGEWEQHSGPHSTYAAAESAEADIRDTGSIQKPSQRFMGWAETRIIPILPIDYPKT